MPLKILIVGGGCAGPALAFWLARAGHRVTIIERHPALRASGAQIDLRAQGIQVAKRMGLIDAIRARVIDEDGVAMVDHNGKAVATFLANKTGKGPQGFSSEFEIMRGDLVQVLYEATERDVEYVFGKTVDRFEQNETGVTAYFSDGKTGTCDILVGADGQGSRVRKVILPPNADPLRHLGLYIAHWRVPTVPTDDKIAKGCLASGGRLVMTRTHSVHESQAAFILRDESEEMRSISKTSVQEQKTFWASRFGDLGWVTPRLIEGMQSSEYFYSQEVVQVRTDTWYKGRVVLLADAAHSPSPMTGMGTTSALVGAYVLAGEITKHSDNIDQAFVNYDKTLRPFINEIQKLPDWQFPMILPKAQIGVSLVYFLVSWIAYLRIPTLLSKFASEEKGAWTLPDYPLLDLV